MSSLRELLAAQAHDSWSGWMDYLFSQAAVRPDGAYIIYPQNVQRWKR